MTWQTEGDAALLKVVLQTFDHGPVWRQAKPPNTTNQVIGHIRRFGSSENELVNSYGVNGVEIICQADTFPVPPSKFDRFTIDTEIFTATDVKPQRGFDNKLIFYRIYCKGK